MSLLAVGCGGGKAGRRPPRSSLGCLKVNAVVLDLKGYCETENKEQRGRISLKRGTTEWFAHLRETNPLDFPG